jgi:hypothetical protein
VASSHPKGVFIGLSSGYDSGAVAAALLAAGLPHAAFSVSGAESLPVLEARFRSAAAAAAAAAAAEGANGDLNGAGGGGGGGSGEGPFPVALVALSKEEHDAAQRFLHANAEPYDYGRNWKRDRSEGVLRLGHPGMLSDR